ncbi:MAG: hypothetical protein CL916_11840 [Deltaproteobacteria bacterium]|nr:hypothetical protein [Deltaproteobacteria bacterium]
MFLLTTLFLACSDSEPQQSANAATQKECPKCPECSKSENDTLSAAEKELLSDSLSQIRTGIKPFDDTSVGVCKGSGKNCEEFLGTTAEDLPEGEYMLQARLLAPKIKPEGGLKVEFHRDCKTTKKTKNGESTTNNNYSKEYKISRNDKGYLLAPLATIRSPNKYGKKECEWKMIFHNTNGTEEIKGSWSVPAKE